MNNKAFDTIIHQKLHSYSAPVPAGLWDKIAAKDLSEPKDSFDEFVHQKLYHHDVEAPIHLWDKIQTVFIPQQEAFNHLEPKEKKRRRFGFWLPQEYRVAASIILVLLIGTVAAYLYNHSFQLDKIVTPTSPVQQQPLGHEEKAVSLQNNTLDKKSPLNNLVDDNKPTTTIESANEIILEDKSTNWKLNKKNKTASFKEQRSVFPFDQSLMENSQKRKNIDLIRTSKGIEKSFTEQVDHTEAEDYTITEKAGNAFIRQNRKTWQGNRHNVNAYQHASSFKNVVICPTDRKMRNPDWDLELYVSPDIAFKTISNNSATAQFLSRKDSSESLRPGFSAGFRIVKPMNEYLSLKTGLQYSQINERFTYKTENETRTTTVVTVRSIVRSPGDTLIVRDTSTLTQVGFKTNTVKNRFRSLDIPLLASVQFGDEDLKWGITAGAIVNISSWYEGVLLDSSLAAVPIGKDNGMMYKKNIGLGLYAGFNITKRINYNTLVFFEPYLRYNLSNMTSPGAAFNQRFSIGGLAVGLRFNLNNK